MNYFGPFFTEKELNLKDAPDEVRNNSFLLVKLCLTQVRKKFGPTIITSGWRSPEHNSRVGGSPTSQHLTGEAADFICRNADMREVFEWLREWWPGQVIYYPDRGHCHVGLPTLKLAKEQRLHQWVHNG